MLRKLNGIKYLKHLTNNKLPTTEVISLDEWQCLPKGQESTKEWNGVYDVRALTCVCVGIPHVWRKTLDLDPKEDQESTGHEVR